jgi:hypothetical protein
MLQERTVLSSTDEVISDDTIARQCPMHSIKAAQHLCTSVHIACEVAPIAEVAVCSSWRL